MKTTTKTFIAVAFIMMISNADMIAVKEAISFSRKAKTFKLKTKTKEYNQNDDLIFNDDKDLIKSIFKDNSLHDGIYREYLKIWVEVKKKFRKNTIPQEYLNNIREDSISPTNSQRTQIETCKNEQLDKEYPLLYFLEGIIVGMIDDPINAAMEKFDEITKKYYGEDESEKEDLDDYMKTCAEGITNYYNSRIVDVIDEAASNYLKTQNHIQKLSENEKYRQMFNEIKHNPKKQCEKFVEIANDMKKEINNEREKHLDIIGAIGNILHENRESNDSLSIEYLEKRYNQKVEKNEIDKDDYKKYDNEVEKPLISYINDIGHLNGEQKKYLKDVINKTPYEISEKGNITIYKKMYFIREFHKKRIYDMIKLFSKDLNKNMCNNLPTSERPNEFCKNIEVWTKFRIGWNSIFEHENALSCLIMNFATGFSIVANGILPTTSAKESVSVNVDVDEVTESTGIDTNIGIDADVSTLQAASLAMSPLEQLPQELSENRPEFQKYVRENKENQFIKLYQRIKNKKKEKTNWLRVGLKLGLKILAAVFSLVYAIFKLLYLVIKLGILIYDMYKNWDNKTKRAFIGGKIVGILINGITTFFSSGLAKRKRFKMKKIK